jgi:uncharacterized membrane protein
MIQESIELDVPVRTAYNQWTQFETFPSFMDGVESVRQIDDKTLEWKARVGGQHLEWTAKIIEQVPDRIIAWHSTTGARHGGSVRFESLGPTRCRVTLQLEVQPEGTLQAAGAALGVVDHKIRGDLKRFQEFLARHGHATGAWRGTIHAGEVGVRMGGEPELPLH